MAMETLGMLPFNRPLTKAQFIERPNRFLVRCALSSPLAEEDNGSKAEAGATEIVEAHLPDPGRMVELFQPGQPIWLQPTDQPGRKTKWTAVLTMDPETKSWVSIDATLPNRLLAKVLAEGRLRELADWKLHSREVIIGTSRFDFLLHRDDGHKLALEVKSVTLVQNRTGLFPDAVTARGRRHVIELTELTQQKGWSAGILFVAQRQDVDQIQPADQIDPAFAQALTQAHRAGVKLMGRRCLVSPSGVALAQPLPVILSAGRPS